MKLTPSQIREGGSSRFLVNLKNVPKDPEKAEAYARRLIQRAGWDIDYYAGRTKFGRETSTTYRNKILLARNFDRLPKQTRAEILFHELVHIRQRKRMGHSKFLRRYATGRGRWCIEVVAFRESLRLAKHFRITRASLAKLELSYLNKLWNFYRLGAPVIGRMRRSQYMEVTPPVFDKA